MGKVARREKGTRDLPKLDQLGDGEMGLTTRREGRKKKKRTDGGKK